MDSTCVSDVSQVQGCGCSCGGSGAIGICQCCYVLGTQKQIEPESVHALVNMKSNLLQR